MARASFTAQLTPDRLVVSAAWHELTVGQKSRAATYGSADSLTTHHLGVRLGRCS